MKKILKKGLPLLLVFAIMQSLCTGIVINADTVNDSPGKADAYEIKVSGPAKIASYTAGAINTYTYSAVVLDSNGTEIMDYDVSLVLDSDAPQNVCLSGNTLTVTGALEKDKHFTILGTCRESGLPSGKKTVTTLDRKTFEDDETRLGIALKYAEKVLDVGTDKTGNTPLLADGVNITSGEFATWNLPANAGLPAETVAMSNLANQGDLMKGLVALSRLTGLEKYKERVNDIYMYYIDNYIDPMSGMVYWGGHATINLNTGALANTSPDAHIHELKTHLPYLNPFFDINLSVGKSIVKSTWTGHVVDFSNLLFSRHAKYMKSYDTENRWSDLDQYDENHDPIVVTRSELPFKNAANDLVYFACKMYQQTGDRNALEWARRLIGKYTAIRNPKTKLGGTQFTTSSCPESKAALEAFEKKVGMKWYELPPDHDLYANRTFSSLGDRAENQFADFAGNGYLPENPEDIREYNLITPDSNYGSGALTDMYLAECFGLDTAEGQQVLRDCGEGMAAWASYAYVPSTNSFKKLWADGTDMTGYVIERGGYYGDKGTVISGSTATADYLLSYSKMYSASSVLNDFDEERYQIWQLVKGVASANNLGELGETGPGDNVKVNLNTSANDPVFIYALCDLYSQTGEIQYLDLARKICDNMIVRYYNHGYFVNANRKFAKFDSQYFYAILLLDACIRGEMDLVDDPFTKNTFYSANYETENGDILYKAYDNKVVWAELASDTVYDIYNNEFDYGYEYKDYDITQFYGWEKNESVAAVISKTPDMQSGISYEAANKALKISGLADDGIVYRNVTDQDNFDVSVGGNAEYSFRVLPYLGDKLEINLNNSSGENTVAVRLEGGNIYLNNSIVSTYVDREWKTVTVKFNTELKECSLYIGNKNVADNISCATEDVIIKDVSFAVSEGGEWYIDNIKINSDKEPVGFIDLTFDKISSESVGYVTENLNLIDSYQDKAGNLYSVVWNSSDTTVVSETGIVNRSNSIKTVNLEATLTKLSDGAAYKKRFYICVIPYGTHIVAEDFETGTENQNISQITSGGWSLYRSVDEIDDLPLQSTVVKDPEADTSEPFNEANKVLMLHRISKAGTNERPRKALDKVSDGDVLVSMRVYFDSTSRRCSINLLNSKRQVISMTYFNDLAMSSTESIGDGKNHQQADSSVSNAYTTGKWSDVVLLLDMKTRTYNVYIDGEKKNPIPYNLYYSPEFQTSNYAGDSIAYIEFDIKKEVTTESKWFIDDIRAMQLSDHMIGDINDDGKMNAKDVTILMQVVAGWNVTDSNKYAYDVNRDGMTNANDVTILLQAVAGWNVAVY